MRNVTFLFVAATAVVAFGWLVTAVEQAAYNISTVEMQPEPEQVDVCVVVLPATAAAMAEFEAAVADLDVALADVEAAHRREARVAFAVAGLVNQMGRGLQRHPHPFVAVAAATARQVAVHVQVAAMDDLDLISHNPAIAMGQGFLIGL
jgi:hypothetical protein